MCNWSLSYFKLIDSTSILWSVTMCHIWTRGFESFSRLCFPAQSLQSCPTLVTPWTGTHQAYLSLGFSRQEYCSGLLYPPPGESSWLRDQTHVSYISCIGRRVFFFFFLTTNTTGKAPKRCNWHIVCDDLMHSSFMSWSPRVYSPFSEVHAYYPQGRTAWGWVLKVTGGSRGQ